MQDVIFKYRLKLTKTKALRFISHLDWQGLILKIFRRLETNLVLSQGFNKMPRVSYSPAMPIFMESMCELVNFQSYDELGDDFIEKFKQNSPLGLDVIEFKKINETDKVKSLDIYCQWALYNALIKKTIYKNDEIRYIINDCLSSDEFLITKKTKKGIEKQVNYRNSLKNIELKDDGTIGFVLKAGQSDTIPSLR
ncbi:TIGR03936 family radical SAM-associated protein, partial [bacterium]|nr:TIGR03936 family radical SAM-associated protein [bacterium]